MGLLLRHKLSGQAAAKAEQWRFCARCTVRLEKGARPEAAEGMMEKADVSEQEPRGREPGSMSASPKRG